jgi:hypothetical protein
MLGNGWMAHVEILANIRRVHLALGCEKLYDISAYGVGESVEQLLFLHGLQSRPSY